MIHVADSLSDWGQVGCLLPFYLNSQFLSSTCLGMHGGEATAPSSRLFLPGWTRQRGEVLPESGWEAAVAGDSDQQCTDFSVQNMHGFEEGVEFLPANNARKVEKGGPRRWVVLVAVLAGLLVLSLMAGLLAWHFQCEWTLLQGPPRAACCEREGGRVRFGGRERRASPTGR